MAKTKEKKPHGKLIWKILCGFFAFLFVFTMIGGPIANNYAGIINMVLGIENSVIIGDENKDSELSDVSLITASSSVDGKLVGKIGVIGPTRMRYSKITSIMEYLTDHLTDSFKLEAGDAEAEEEDSDPEDTAQPEEQINKENQ